ncbi:retron St85 family RNA-directed DNA polymerase [Brevundimonas sp. SGAir0440]|uniref:retron St85 family RNA-directed DNA polymerase n=1 Tax=Brevundimonas sp. SGAir0440 TaxID=2579977 RepID=UPI00143DDD77|nr:retron St85 family RNA-directed DNA polymerase [Brevundimonas sp. SGAir0440]
MIDDLIGLLSRMTGLPPSAVRRIILSAPRRYKVYYIDKRSGGKREIAHPARELKLLQRAFLDAVLEDLPVHVSATAYIKGKSLKDNALPHVGAGPILKMDFRDFFPSIRAKDWIAYAREHRVFSNDHDAELSALLLFRRPKGESVLRLSVGAPTSPALSNILMYNFDQAVWASVGERFVTYTRYADDMTFSAARTGFLQGVQTRVSAIIREMSYPKLELNHQKTRFVTEKYHRDVTGLTLSLDNRVTIGQLRKRNIRAGLHQAKLGQLSREELQTLSGHIAFAADIEPEYIGKMKERYGEDLLDWITKGRQSDDR